VSETAPGVDTSESHAKKLDADDPLASFRERFHIPRHPVSMDGPSIYLCGNSLGCMPRGVAGEAEMMLEDWARLGVEGHFFARDPWYAYHEQFREPYATLLGAKPEEVVAMNTLTVNLHLLMASFYRPTKGRYKVLIDGPCFPSDVYAVRSQIRERAHAVGVDPDGALVWVDPREGEHCVREEDIEGAIAEHGDSLALVLLAGVNYYSGKFYDCARIVRAAHEAGAIAGLDLAHAAGNAPVDLHQWNADFAVWCTYKYLNSGPGAVGGAFVHRRHLDRDDYKVMPRLEGWWGNDPDERFRMSPEFEPVRRADAWSLSNPPILSLLPVKVSLGIFMEAGYGNLREKSVKLTSYLEKMIGSTTRGSVRVITPGDPDRRGCQLSLLMPSKARETHDTLRREGVICDLREPDVIRVAPTPLYNTFHDCWRFAEILGRATG